ncbi:MAG: DUF4403 family protein [Cetobacterium sp.]|uniref:DUF4403 family protein n=1 Tax=Cetobacterium sp. TaxID=2071632 RepID=UPI003F2A7B23
MKLNKIIISVIALNIISSNSTYSEESLSKLDINISLKKSIVENIINSQLPYTIEDTGSGTEIFNSNKNNILGTGLNLLGAIDKKFAQSSESFIWAYKINRSPIVFNANGQEVGATTNIDGQFKASWNRDKQGTEMKLNGTAGIKSIVSVSPDWKLVANSSPFLNISNDNIPLDLNLYGLKFKTDINIGSSLEKSISSKLQKATKEIDSKIESFNLREIIEKYWSNLKEPILVNKDYNLWLTINPKSARYSDLISFNEDLGIKVGADANLHLYIGEKPANQNLNSLPEMNFGFVDDSFNINLPISTTYNNLNDMINKNIVDKEFDLYSGIKYSAQNVALSSDNSNLNFETNFKLSVFGFLNPTGVIKGSLKPNFNKENGVFVGENFDYSLESNSIILNVINKIFKRSIKNSIIKNYLSFDPNKEIELAKVFIQSKVNDIELDKNIHLQSEINTFKLVDLKVDTNVISLTVNTTGKSTIQITE